MPDIPLQEVERQFRLIQRECERFLQELVPQVEQLLLRLQRERFSRLSQGKEVDGDQWAKPKRNQLPMIGVRTRKLQNSLTSVIRRSGRMARLDLRYEAAYAWVFDNLRPLLPDVVPKPWAAQINRLIFGQLDKFAQRLRSAGLID